VTSRAIIARNLAGKAASVARASGVVAGLPAVDLVFNTVNTPLLKFQPIVQDGVRVNVGDRVAIVSGILVFILTAERTALNFLQHLSGVATLTRRYVDAISGLPCKIYDTRKTIPGWRLLEKYAVRCGGGHNHRMGLYDGILVKDNHLAALGTGKEAFRLLSRGLAKSRENAFVEIEVDSVNQLDWAFACIPDVILLDNMNVNELYQAV